MGEQGGRCPLGLMLYKNYICIYKVTVNREIGKLDPQIYGWPDVYLGKRHQENILKLFLFI